jgi:hypothetical protein
MRSDQPNDEERRRGERQLAPEARSPGQLQPGLVSCSPAKGFGVTDR